MKDKVFLQLNKTLILRQIIMLRFFVRSAAVASLFCMFAAAPLSAQEMPLDSLFKKAQLHMVIYQYQEAVSLLEKILETDTAATQTYWLLGQCYASLGQTAAAKHTLESLLQQDSIHTPALAMLGQLYLKETNYRQAALRFDEVLAQDTANAYFYRQRAFAAHKSDDVAGAIFFYQKALALAPQDTESLTELAELLVKLEEGAQAALLIRHGLQQDSTHLRLWRLQARLAYKQKEYAQVVQALAYPLAAGDTALYYLQLLGISQFHLGNYSEAIRWLTYLQQQGVDTEVLNYYLGLSYRNAGEKAKGILHLERAAQKGVSDNLSHYYTQLAITHEEKGDYSRAIQAYQLAYKGSGDKKLLYHLARNYDQYYKDKKVALSYYEKYLAAIDTANTGYQDYARYRASQLKEHIHFSVDSL